MSKPSLQVLAPLPAPAPDPAAQFAPERARISEVVPLLHSVSVPPAIHQSEAIHLILGPLCEAMRASSVVGFVWPTRTRVPLAFTFQGCRAEPLQLSHNLDELLVALDDLPLVVHSRSPGDARYPLDVIVGALEAANVQEHLWVVLRNAGEAFGVLGLARSSSCGFSWREQELLATMAGMIAGAITGYVTLLDAQTELIAARALGVPCQRQVLIERTTGRVVWSSQSAALFNWGQQISAVERKLVASAEGLSAARGRDEAPATPFSCELGLMVAAAEVASDSLSGGGYLAAGFLPTEALDTGSLPLSKQEQRVVRFLSHGYQPLNIAALTGISEHTVRTYIRRAYKKLNVRNRADLVRRLLSTRVK